MADSNKEYLVGVDLGGTKMLVGVMNQDYRILGDDKEKVEIDKGEKHFIDTLKDAVEQTLDEANVSVKNLHSVGIGCPGIIDSKKGVVISSPNIPFLKKFPLAQKIKLYLENSDLQEKYPEVFSGDFERFLKYAN